MADDPTPRPARDDLAAFFGAPEPAAVRPPAPPDELADFFGSPTATPTVAVPPAAAPPAPAAPPRSIGSRAPLPGDDLASFFRSPDSPGGDGAATGRPSLRRAAPPPSRPAAPPPPTGPAAVRRRRTGRILASFLAVVAVGFMLVAGTVAWLSRDLPSLEQIENPRNLLATRVFTSDDVELARYYDGENRTWVSLEDMNPAVPKALIATEDRRFYEHWGMDLRGFAAVALQAAQGGSLRGASTITMQLARNLYTSVGRERSLVRKAKEILTAIRIERTYTKDEILEAYLNTVPFLYNAYGIEAASQTYFGKHAADLNTPEAATLVGMLAANTAYDPVRNPEASRERRNIVLANMRRSGDLNEAQYVAARESPVDVAAFNVYDHANNPAPHFSEVLRLWFKEWCADNGYDPYKDGLVIRTTLDSRMQALATQAVQSQGARIQQAVGGYQGWWARNTAIVNEYISLSERYTRANGRPWSGRRADLDMGIIADLRRDGAFMDSLRVARTRVEAGLVAIDPVSGQVKAWVGGRSFADNKFDHVGQARRQPGSTFKLFAYTTAFNNGYSMQSTALDAPFRWGDWSPQNSGGGYAGTVTLASALAASRNVVAARITKHFGTAEVARTAYQMGIRSPLELPPPPNATAAQRREWAAKCRPFTAASNDCYARSIALGTADVSLLEMAVGYSTIADYGVYHGPTLEEERPRDPSIPPQIVLAVARIEDRYGNVVEDFTPVAREVLNASTAYTMFDAMRGVIRSGTGRGLGGFPGVMALDIAGKTGTTQENADGWFMAMSRSLVAGSWTGFDDRRIKYPSTAIGQGGRTGLLVVGEFLRLLQADSTGLRIDPALKFEKPANFQPPTRAGRIGGSGGTMPYSRSRGDRTGADRPRSGGSRSGTNNGAREMIDQFRNRDRSSGTGGGGGGGGSRPAPAPAPAAPRPQTEGGGSGGRIGW